MAMRVALMPYLVSSRAVIRSAGSVSEGDDLLALVAVERFAPCDDCLFAVAGGFEYLGEIAVRLRLPLE